MQVPSGRSTRWPASTSRPPSVMHGAGNSKLSRWHGTAAYGPGPGSGSVSIRRARSGKRLALGHHPVRELLPGSLACLSPVVGGPVDATLAHLGPPEQSLVTPDLELHIDVANVHRVGNPQLHRMLCHSGSVRQIPGARSGTAGDGGAIKVDDHPADIRV